MKSYIDNKGKIIKATETAFNLLYKNRGFRPLENEPLNQPVEENKEPIDVLGIEDYTKAQIVEILSQRGIKHNTKDRKDILYDLLVAGE